MNAPLPHANYRDACDTRHGFERLHVQPPYHLESYWRAVRESGWNWRERGRMPLPLLCCRWHLVATRVRVGLALAEAKERDAELAALGSMRNRSQDQAARETLERQEARGRAWRKLLKKLGRI